MDKKGEKQNETLGDVLKDKIPDIEAKFQKVVKNSEKNKGVGKSSESEILNIDVDNIANLFFNKKVIDQYCKRVRKDKALEIIKREAEAFADVLAEKEDWSKENYKEEILKLLENQPKIPRVLREILDENKGAVEIPKKLAGVTKEDFNKIENKDGRDKSAEIISPEYSEYVKKYLEENLGIYLDKSSSKKSFMSGFRNRVENALSGMRGFDCEQMLQSYTIQEGIRDGLFTEKEVEPFIESVFVLKQQFPKFDSNSLDILVHELRDNSNFKAITNDEFIEKKIKKLSEKIQAEETLSKSNSFQDGDKEKKERKVDTSGAKKEREVDEKKKKESWPKFSEFKKNFHLKIYEDEKNGNFFGVSPMYIEVEGGRELIIRGYSEKTGEVLVEITQFYSNEKEDIKYFKKPIQKKEKIKYGNFLKFIKKFEIDYWDENNLRGELNKKGIQNEMEKQHKRRIGFKRAGEDRDRINFTLQDFEKEFSIKDPDYIYYDTKKNVTLEIVNYDENDGEVIVRIINPEDEIDELEYCSVDELREKIKSFKFIEKKDLEENGKGNKGVGDEKLTDKTGNPIDNINKGMVKPKRVPRESSEGDDDKKEPRSVLPRDKDKDDINKNSPEEIDVRIEELRVKMEASYDEVIKAQKNEAVQYHKLGSFKKIKDKIYEISGKKKKSQSSIARTKINLLPAVEKEYLNSKGNLQNKKEIFSREYQLYIKNLLSRDVGRNVNVGDLYMYNILNGKGEAVSIFEDFNSRLKDLDEFRIKATHEYQLEKGEEEKSNIFKKICFNALSYYRKVPKSVRMIATATLVGMTAGASGGVALGLKMGLSKFGKSALIAVASGSAGAFFKLISNKKGENDHYDTTEKIASLLEDNLPDFSDENFLKLFEDFNEREKKRNFKVAVATGLTAGLMTFGVMGISNALENGIDSGDPSGPNHIARPDNIGGSGEENDVSKAPNEIKKSTIPVTDEIKKTGLDEIVKSEVAERLVTTSSIDHGIESTGVHEYSVKLEKGDNVWGKLVDHFEGNQNKTGNTILKFQKDIAKQLVVEHDMSADQAKSFVHWRFRHMGIGEVFQLDQSGNLQIDGFIDQSELERFAGSTVGKNIGMDDLLAENSGESVELDDGTDGYSEDGSEKGVQSSDLGYNIIEADGALSELEQMVNIFQDKKITPDVWNSMNSVKVKDILIIPIENEEVTSFIKDGNNLSGIKKDLKIPANSSIGNINEKKFEQMVKIARMVREDSGVKNLDRLNITVGKFLVKHIDKIKQ